MLSTNVTAQLADTSTANTDVVDTAKKNQGPIDIYKGVVDSNYLLNRNGLPQSMPVSLKNKDNRQVFFYCLLMLFLFFGIAKTIYSRYFNILFKVFFNTSLRQNQLTDQLDQAKLPSIIFNFFFIVTSGFYIYFLMNIFTDLPNKSNLYNILLCILSVGICYSVKYISLLFIGWLTNSKAEANTYIFIIFLLNKILGIFFLIILPVLAFSNSLLASYAILFSLIGISLIFLVRFFRSYSLLQSSLKVSRFHFFIYIFSLEILPLAIIYKFVMLYFNTKS